MIILVMACAWVLLGLTATAAVAVVIRGGLLEDDARGAAAVDLAPAAQPGSARRVPEAHPSV